MERIKFSIHFSFLLMLVCAFLFKQGFLFLMYSVAMIMHELAHYFVAKRLFFQCTKLQLSAFGAVLYGEFTDAQGKSQTEIALAGPLANILLALLCFALWWLVPESYYFTLDFCEANLGMAAINFIPAYPLDGGKVLLGIIQQRHDEAKSIKIVKSLTVIISLALFAVFLLALLFKVQLFSLALFAMFLFSAYLVDNDGKNYRRMSFCSNYSRRLKVGMEKKTLIFNENSTFDKVICRMQGNSLYCLEVVNSKLQKVSFVDVQQLDYLLIHCPPSTKLCQIESFLHNASLQTDCGKLVE